LFSLVVEKFNYLNNLLSKMNLKYSLKFIWGVVLVVLSLILGGVAKVFFILYLDNQLIVWSMVALYIISWPMLVLGVWWVGKEYANSIKRYFHYKYYHKYVQAGSRKVYHVTKNKAMEVHTKARIKAKDVQIKAKEKSNRLKQKVQVSINNNKNKIKARRINFKKVKDS
jgi:hypothetical protein